MSGCLPLIIQFPLLFGMLWTMQAISSEHIVQIIQTLEAGGTPVLENWLWVKNVFCADTLFAAVIPISRDVMSLQATATCPKKSSTPPRRSSTTPRSITRSWSSTARPSSTASAI